jgi:phospholipase C
MVTQKRRDFLRMSAASVGVAAGGSAWLDLVQRALATEPHRVHNDIRDVEHVVIFMQENRSFDHYFGMLPGVRGFGDPRPVPLPSGKPVWYQPEGTNPTVKISDHVSHDKWTAKDTWYQADRSKRQSRYVLPFALSGTAGTANFQYAGDLDHSWKASQDIWQDWDVWVPLKSKQTMGYLTPEDLPFYTLLANNFTVCDAYHCSVFAATDPNRLYLWSGTCPPPMNFPDNYSRDDKGNEVYVADIRNDNNSKITPSMYGDSPAAKKTAIAAGVADWLTYAEVLGKNDVSWKVFQEYDNYGDNYLQYFKNFRIDSTGKPISQSRDDRFKGLYDHGRTFAASSTVLGESVIDQFQKAMESPEGLPQVSWIVAPYKYCEHPSAAPGDGENFTAAILNALVQNPEVWAKTVFLIMYDENDGYFDHVPAPIPPITSAYGQTTLAQCGADEIMTGTTPVGLGPRVPMLVISPWSVGGRVCSQLFDHTSVLRFLEEWQIAKGADPRKIRCPNISPWRRTVCGDLTSAFDFSGGKTWPAAVKTVPTPLKNGAGPLAVPNPQVLPSVTYPFKRAACPLPYRFFVHENVTRDGEFGIDFDNLGKVGAHFIAYRNPGQDRQTAYHYTVEGRRSLTATLQPDDVDGRYHWSVFGPDSYLAEFKGIADQPHRHRKPEVRLDYDRDGRGVRVTLRNSDDRPCEFEVSEAYNSLTRTQSVRARSTEELRFSLSRSLSWYDVSIRLKSEPGFLRRFSGRVQTADEAWSDPAIGKPQLA